MKKFYLQAIIIVFTAYSSFAQLGEKQISKNHPQAALKSLLGYKNTSHYSPNNVAAIIWSDDFSTPANWTITHASGTASDWVIGTTGPSGPFMINPIASTSAANGFALFDSDLMCDAANGQIGDLTTTTSVNCSGHPSVKLKFQEYYRRFYDSTNVYISNDNVSWTQFPVNASLANNEFCGGGTTGGVNPTDVSIDVSSVAGNQATVWVRFEFYSPTSLGANAGCAYAWMVDDASLEDIASDDIAMVKSFPSPYTIIPLTQVQPIDLSARVANPGGSTETNVGFNANVYLIQNGSASLVFNGPSATAASLIAGDTTAALSAGSFTPTDTGAYAFQYISFMTNTDGDNSNDTSLTFIIVSDSTYARDESAIDGLFANALGFNGNTGSLGQIYDLYNSRVITSATFYLSAPTLADHVSVSIYSVTGGVPDVLLGTTAQHTVDATDVLGNFITLSFSPPIAVSAGQFFVGVDQIDQNNITLALCTDVFNFNTVYFEATGGAWTTLESIPFIGSFILRPNLDFPTGIEDNTVFNNNMIITPNPSNGFIYLQNKSNDKSLSLEVFNSVGQIVYTRSIENSLENTIDLRFLGKGIYEVKITGEKSKFTQKLILN